jgi:hypothetical protein
MKRPRWWWWALPFALAGLVLLIAPPVSLTDPPKKPPKIEIRSARPESIELPGYTAPAAPAMSPEAEAAKPAAPRTREELEQVRVALKDQEKKLLARRKSLDPNDRAAMQALVDEISRYNDDIRSFEEASAVLEPSVSPAPSP